MLRVLVFLAALFCSTAAFAAPDAMLDRPDADIKRLYPESTTYRVRAFTGQLKSDAPLTYYAVYKGAVMIGLVHGTAFEASNGTMQVFVAYTKSGQIRDVYIQKIESKYAPYFRSKYYRVQYRKFGFNELPEDAYVKPPVRLPPKEVLADHQALIRAVRENITAVKQFSQSDAPRTPKAE